MSFDFIPSPIKQSDRSLRRCSRGAVLIVVLVVITILSLVAYGFSSLMQPEFQGVLVNGRAIQAKMLANSGVEMIKRYLAQDPQSIIDAGGTHNNPGVFQAVIVFPEDDSRSQGQFSVIAPDMVDGKYSGIRYGLENESTRMNLNTLLLAEQVSEDAARELLMALPQMTEEIADAILDWIDDDEEPREFGAEADYYSSLTPPYAPKNGPLSTVEELLLIKGITPELLFGGDVNRNGIIDKNEASTGDEEMDLGWAAYLTLFSQEANVQPDGSPRIDLNNDNLAELQEQLSAVFEPKWVTYIIAYRLSGPYSGSKSGEMASGDLDLTKKPRVQFSQVLDLIGTKTEVTFTGDDDSTVLESPFVEGPLAYAIYLPTLMDHVSVNPDATIPGRINVNDASEVVLRGLPNMNEEILTELLSQRQGQSADENPTYQHETWLLTQQVVTLDEMKALMPYVTAGGSVFRAQVVGFFEQGSSYRTEVVIDTTGDTPRVILSRDLTHLGRGYNLEDLSENGSDE